MAVFSIIACMAIENTRGENGFVPYEMSSDKVDIVKIYSNEASHPILTHERVMELSQQMERGRASLLIVELYRGNSDNASEFISPITMNQVLSEHKLGERIKLKLSDAKNPRVKSISFDRSQGPGVISINSFMPDIEAGVKAREELLRNNLRLVSQIAEKRYEKLKGGYQFLDLVQYGNFGLMNAVDTFNWRLGWQFSTHAARLIAQAITTNTIKDQLKRVPHEISEDLKDYEDADSYLYQAFKREPAVEEIAKYMNIPIEKAIALQRVYFERILASTEDELPQVDDGKIGDMLEAPDDTAKEAFYNIREDFLRKLLGSLSEEDRRLLEMKYGIDEKDELTNSEIAVALGLSENQVVARHQAIIKNFRLQYLEEEA